MEWWIYGGLTLLLVGVVVAAFLAFRNIGEEQAKLRYVQEHGEPVLACIVDELRHLSLSEGYTPVLALITFDRTIPNHQDYLDRLARRMWAFKQRDPANPEEYTVARLVREPNLRPDERVQLPSSFTGGPVVYCVRFIVYQRLLQREGPIPPFVRCLAAADRPDTPVEMIETPNPETSA